MTTRTANISIVTPSFNMLTYLPRAHASIADQGVAVEHIVMDGGSTDGTRDWLKHHKGITSVSEKDRGMYHALNKAIAKASAPIIGHLNCDEQYLPGTLKRVLEYFEANPETDFISADFIIVNPEGEFLAYRKSFQPKWEFFFSNYLYVGTCTLFYRRSVFEKCRFDEDYRSIADVIFLYNVLRNGFRGRHLRFYSSTFTYSGANLSLHPISAAEKQRFDASLPGWYRFVRPLFFVLFFFRKIIHGCYFERGELSYDIFSQGYEGQRKRMTKHNPTFRIRFK